MRILAIRGRNLASLAGDFAVDFRAEPLASAGVFAISGPTGAGKSTLLDAMCLALYHDTPRLRAAREASILIPDVMDQTLTPQDPRHLLRRGCAEGYAEVDFEDQAGIEWRARWSVARAHAKVGKRLQPAQVSLLHIADNQFTGGTLRETQERLVQLTGLSFEQFCRSVLLAQNDFAALLKARQEERAGLLEALTGTEIFSQLSKLAHQRNSHEQQQLRALEAELGAQPPLDDATLASLQAACVDAREHRDQLAQQLQTLEREAAWHQRGDELRCRQVQIHARAEELADALRNDSALQRQLRLWATAATLRPLADMVHTSEAELALQRTDRPALQQSLTDTATALTLARSAMTQAELALTQAQIEREKAQPQIQAARSADTQIQLASAAAQQAQAQQDRVQAQLTRVLGEIELVTQQRATHLQAGAIHRQWQQDHPQLMVTGPEWIALGHRLQTLSTARLREIDTRTRLEPLQQALAVMEQSATSARQRVDQDSLHHQQCSVRTIDAERFLATLDAATLGHRQQQWLHKDRATTRLTHIIERHAKAQQLEQTLGLRLLQYREQAGEAQVDWQLAQATLTTAASEGCESENAFRRASLVADAHTEQLRELLVDGQPCPVCGARKHAHEQAPASDLGRVLASLQAQAVAARDAHQKAIAEEQRCSSAVLHAQQRLLESNEEHNHAARALFEQAAEMQSTAHSLSAQTIAIAAMTEWMWEWQQQLTLERTALDQAQTTVDQALAAREAAREAQDLAEHAQQQAQAQLDVLLEQLQPQRQSVERLLGELAAITRECQSEWLKLQPSALQRQCTIENIPALLTHWQQGEQWRASAELATQALQVIDTTLVTLQAKKLETDSLLLHADLGLQQAKADLQQHRVHRLSVLAHADTEAHATALEASLSSARASRESCAHVEAERLQAQTGAQHRWDSAEQQLTQLQSRLQQQLLQLQREWSERLREAQLGDGTLDDFWMLLRQLPADLSAQLQSWSAREQALTAAQLELDALTQSLHEWQQQAASSRVAALVQEALTTTRAARDLALQQLGALEQQLREDGARRIAAASKLAELQTRRQQAQCWVELDQLIGAADGSKFKRYAQQYTLEVLLEYANQHLARLAPRYRLRRGLEALSLLIIDSDLGNELRSVHSLSGGETFLVSLALALGLASLSSQRVRVESLFIDEGFGSLDAATLNTAMEALDRLQSEGRRVGVISHVHDMAERIGVQIRVEPMAPGRSRVRVMDGAESL